MSDPRTPNDEQSADRYAPASIEPKWQKYWDEHNTFAATRTEGRKKAYVLDMFPYPSGAGLHVGHPEGYTATDIVCRAKRMQGVDVLHPMGWDAFGLPAEQHAIRTGTHPRATTASNIDNFRRQLKMLGFSYDWSREVDTTDPKYVRWTQWIFLQLFKKGLAFQQSDMPVNWCPELGTVLANDEIVDGKSEVGGFPVERLKIRQWSLRITQYADQLLDGLADLNWPETKAKQAHWIGRSEGAIVNFAVDGHADANIAVFTTRVDTLAGATYVVLAPEHALVAQLVRPETRAKVDAYVQQAAGKSDMDRSDATREKTGEFLGCFAINPINGEKLPVWIGDYVIATYGTGAVMAVPAHDERDHAFAKKYNLPIVAVVDAPSGPVDVSAEAYTDDGVCNAAAIGRSQCALEAGEPSAAVRSRVTAWLAEQGKGERRITYKLRDWVFSRQRYWGEPIPIYFPVTTDGDPRVKGAAYTVHYDRPIAVDEAELPLLLPDLEDFKPGTDPAGPLARAADWRFFQKDGAWYARETNTMPQWAGSCWYYLRFLDPHNDTAAFSEAAYNAWMPVDLYVGGAEHAVLHLLYARFWHKVMFDIGLVKHDEPFTRLIHQGLILGEDSQKMSKSRGNVVNPDDIVKSHGADALRLYEMFMGPLEAVKPWQSNGIEGVARFLDRVWNVATGNVSDSAEAYDIETRRAVHKTIKKVTEDIEALRFNTAISAMMILVKQLGALPLVPRRAVQDLVLLVSPFAPHIAEELWQRLGGKTTLAYEPWPTFDAELVVDATVEIGVQVNGKARSAVTIAVDATEQAAQEIALADEKIKAFLVGKTIKKVIYVKGRIVNIIAQ